MTRCLHWSVVPFTIGIENYELLTSLVLNSAALHANGLYLHEQKTSWKFLSLYAMMAVGHLAICDLHVAVAHWRKSPNTQNLALLTACTLTPAVVRHPVLLYHGTKHAGINSICSKTDLGFFPAFLRNLSILLVICAFFQDISGRQFACIFWQDLSTSGSWACQGQKDLWWPTFKPLKTTPSHVKDPQ